MPSNPLEATDLVSKGVKELAALIVNERALYYKETGELRDLVRALTRRVEILEGRAPKPYVAANLKRPPCSRPHTEPKNEYVPNTCPECGLVY